MTSPHDRDEPRQRWRVRYARNVAAATLTQREEAGAWLDALDRSDLPLVRSGSPPRPRVAFAAALPVGVTAEDEPLEVLLTARRTVAEVRDSISALAPPNHRVVRVHDVWLGAAPLPALVCSVEYEIVTGPVDAGRLASVADALVAAPELPRERVRATRTVHYDLRPLIESLKVDPVDQVGPVNATIRFRGRVDPQRGIGRPDEVVAALGERLGGDLTVERITRTRVGTLDDPT